MKFFPGIFLLLCSLSIFGQDPSRHGPGNVPPSESLVVHVNGNLFLAGETMFFKVYCVNRRSGQLSSMSKLAYVELVNEKAEISVRLKVPLINGEGAGDYFFDPSFPSGNLMIVAYTRWMLNEEPDIEGSTIAVINPRDPPKVSISPQENLSAQKTSDTGVTVTTDKRSYGKREKVTTILAAPDSALKMLSVSVRRVDEGDHGSMVHASIKKKKAGEVSSELRTHLPDLRGELLSGTVTRKGSRQPLANAIVTLSSPKKDWVFLVSRTDGQGRYYFSLPVRPSGQLLLKVTGYSMDSVNVRPDNDATLTNRSRFTPPKLSVDSATLVRLGKRYLATQVRMLFEKRMDSIQSHPSRRILTAPDRIYRLDDFTRFPTMEDVFREIVGEVVVKTKGSLTLRNTVTGERFFDAPLMLIDGVPVDGEALMQFDPLLVREIVIVARRYYYGPIEADGVVAIETYDGVAESLDVSGFFSLSYLSPLDSRVYTAPTYHGHRDMSRIADYRTQLYWNPNVTLNSQSEISFFTGDVPGHYTIDVVGVKDDGVLLFASESFVID